MAIKNSGNSLAFSEIASEFGSPSGNNLGAYRVSETHGTLSNMPLDTNIPQSGEIKFSQFYTKRLNIVVDFHSGGEEFRQNARTDKYNASGSGGSSSGNWNVVGGFRNVPSDSGEAPTGGVRGKKVFINVNKTIGGESASNQQVCALRTGSWEADTQLTVDIGGSGRIFGAGGDGGKGKSKDFGGAAINGGDGNSGLGVEYNGTTVNVASGGIISCGYGGGGGGGTASNKDRGHPHRHGSGSGGGGGAGYPGGAGGEKTGTDGTGETGSDGTPGGLPDFSNSSQPTGGGRSGQVCFNSHWWEARGGLGGVGGPGAFQQFTSGDPGTFNTPGTYNSGPKSGIAGAKNGGGGGQPGSNGAGIRRTSGISVTINNSGTITGGTNATGVQ